MIMALFIFIVNILMEIVQSLKEWIVAEGVFRMLEHLILLLVAVRFVKGVLSI